MAASSPTFVWLRNNVDKLHLHVSESRVIPGKCGHGLVATRQRLEVRIDLVAVFYVAHTK